LGQDEWNFAVEIQALRNAGASNSDLRWLLGKGHVEHATEVTRPDDLCRRFRRDRSLRFNRKTCFVLMPSGAWLTCSTPLGQLRAAGSPVPPYGPEGSAVADRSLVPWWDRDRREVRLAGILVKQFKSPAPNQEAILAAFEEEGWPPRIDDPISPQFGQDPKRRLHDTINALNRNQKTRLIDFLGDGSGQGVRWEINIVPDMSDVAALNGAGATGAVQGCHWSAH
jgi:hypothetical protein